MLYVVIPIILNVGFVDVSVGVTQTGGRSNKISPPSFCGARINFSREKDPAVPFPRRPSSRILCTNDLIVLHLLDIFILLRAYNELPICMLQQFGLGCIQTSVHFDQSEMRRMFLFVVVVFGKYQYRIFSCQTSVPKMAERTRNYVGVEECKGFTPPNVPTTSASTTRLPLGSLNLNTRVPDTGTATPSSRRLTESQRSASLATKRARYAQRTEGQRLHDAHERRTRRPRQQQQANAHAAAAVEAALRAQHEETTRRAGNYSAVVRCAKLLRIRCMSLRVLETKFQRIYIF